MGVWVQVPSRLQFKCSKVMNEKRLEQLRETWVKNVMKVQNITRAEAEVLYSKIQPHNLAK